MTNVHTAYVIYAGKVYKATLTAEGYYVGALNVLLPFPSNQVISLSKAA